MSDEDKDVGEAGSSPAGGPEPHISSDPASPGVMGVTDETIVGDRPLKNIKAELERKFNDRLDMLTQQIAQLASASQRQPPPAPAPQFSDDQLADLAAAGQKSALVELTDRRAAQAADQRFHALTVHQGIIAQLNTLYAKYPDLLNPSTPLGQLAVRHKWALVNQGLPNAHGTDLEAVKNALIDGVQHIQAPKATPEARGVTPQQSIDGLTVRRTPARPPAVPAVTDKEFEIARRMNPRKWRSKEDVAKSKQRFEERQAKGQSGLGAVAALVREE